MDVISLCLIGAKCRYDGKSKENLKMVHLVQNGLAIPICPEQLGGLSTPRNPSEIQSNKTVLNAKGEDVTEAYLNGANETLKIAKLVNAKKAYLKSKSPMCGCGEIYDGSFSSNLKEGDGILTELLKKNSIEVISID